MRPNFHTCNYKNQSGVSLIELMISITLGLFLIWGVTQSFLSSKQIYSMQQGLARIQENGRLAQEFIGYDIRNAGDYGCASGDAFIQGTSAASNQPDTRNYASCNGVSGAAPYGTAGIDMLSTHTSIDDDFMYSVYGFDGGDTTVPSAVDSATGILTTDTGVTITLNPAPKANTDVLMVHTSEDIGVLESEAGQILPTALASPAITTLTLNASATLLATDRIAVSDCATTKVFGVAASAAMKTVTLGGNYCAYAGFAKGSSVRKLSAVYYYVAASTDGTGFSLYRKTPTATDELLQGVEDMQLTFGVDTDSNGSIDAWRVPSAVTVAEWNGWDWTIPLTPVPSTCSDSTTYVYANCPHSETSIVRAVRYSLLMRSEDQVMGAVQTISYNNASIVGGGTNDRRLRQVFTGTVGIRSRVKFN